MKNILISLMGVLALALFVACDDDDDDDEGLQTQTEDQTATSEPTETEDPTAQPTDEPTEEPTDEPTAPPTDDSGDEVGDCADDASELLPEILERLDAGDAEGVFNCLSEDARQAFGPDLESFADGDFHSFEEGLGSFPADTPVIFTQEIEDGPQIDEQVTVTAIMGDRMVEGTAEEDAVYATLAVFEDGSWRADPLGEFSLSEFSPEPFSTVAVGPLTVAYTITDIEVEGEFAADARIFFNGGQVTEPVAEAFEGIRVSGGVTAQAGANWVIAYVEQDGAFAVFGWSFQGE